MHNYRKTVVLVREMIQTNQCRELRRLIQGCRWGLALIQFAVAEIETSLGFVPVSVSDTLHQVEEELKEQGLARTLSMYELHFVWFMENAWVKAYDDWTKSAEAQAMLRTTVGGEPAAA